MSITNMLGKPLKHYATNKTTGERYIMLALENETDPNTCSVIEMDKLDSDMRSELREIIDSDACQREIDTWRFLDTKFFMNYPKQTILSVLRALRVIKTPKSEDVLIQLPGDIQQTPAEVMDAIRTYRKKQTEQKSGIITDSKINSSKDETSTNALNDIELLKTNMNEVNYELKQIKEDMETKLDKILKFVEMMALKKETSQTSKKK